LAATDSLQASPPPRPPLAEGYYVDNFETVLRTVLARYDDLLDDAEHSLARRFLAASQPARRLYVRLIMRKGPLFRRDLLLYPEIADLDAAAAELEDVRLLDRAGDAAAVDLLAVLRRPELRELAAELASASGDSPPPRGGRRAEVEDHLLQHPDDVLTTAVHSRWTVLRPLEVERLLVYRLLFFGNLGQTWSEFVLADLGIVRYEAYELRREQRRFEHRQAVDHTLELLLARSQVGEWLEAGDLDSALALARTVLADLDAWHALARRHADRILVRVGREAERAGDLEAALELYAGAERPPARERRCRVLARLGHLDDALAGCREIAASPRDETEVAFASPFAHRLEVQLGRRTDRLRRRRPSTLEMVLPPPSSPEPVEVRALAALAEQGLDGVFSENWLWRSLFGLAFWDVVFLPVPDAFHHPFQLGPLDLDAPEFRTVRAGEIETRLQELRNENDLVGRLWPVYEAKLGTANRLVEWHPALADPLRRAAERVPGTALATICDRLSRHLGRYRRGLPDLLIFDPASPIGFELLEVKGPGDQLRPEQTAWIEFLVGAGIPARLLKVRW
jgi:FAN1, HTH domain/VRR-NUC domain